MTDGAPVDGEFGPNSELVADLLSRLEGLTLEQLQDLARCWEAADQITMDTAHSALRRAVRKAVAEDPASRSQVEEAQRILLDWVDDVPPLASRFGGLAPQAYAREAASMPIADAIDALSLADVLDPRDAEILYTPWATVVGRPLLPTFVEDSE